MWFRTHHKWRFQPSWGFPKWIRLQKVNSHLVPLGEAYWCSFSVVNDLRLANGVLFPIPVTLDVSRTDLNRLSISPGSRITLLDPRDEDALAIITGIFFPLSIPVRHWHAPLVEDIYTPDLVKEAVQVFGADDPAHPSVSYLRNRVKDFYVGGKVQAIKAPTHFDYVALRCKFISKKHVGMTWINKS